MALRGFAGAGQNMYIYPSLFKEFGGNWFSGKKVVVNSPEAVRALDWYVDAESKYAPPAVRNWNWPDIADAFSQGTLGCYIDAHSSAAVLMNPEKSKVIGKMRVRALAEGTDRQARHVDLELGLSDQRRAVREAEARDVAVHPVGRGGGNAGAHVVEVRRARRSARDSIARRCGSRPNSSR